MPEVKRNEPNADAEFKGGLAGMIVGGGAAAAGHKLAENLIPSLKGKLNRNTFAGTALVGVAIGAYIGGSELWKKFDK